MDSLLDQAWAWLVHKLIAWALSTFKTFLLWWMSDSAYDVQLTGEKGGLLYSLREYTNWLTAGMAFAGFLVAAFRIAIQRRGEPFRKALSQFVELAVIILTLASLVNLANIAGDRYSDWVIGGLKPSGDAWIDNWQKGFDLLGGDQTDVSFIVAAFALGAAVATVIQFVLMLFRSGAMIILVGILPAVAASRFSAYGDAAYRKCIGLLISFIIVKPLIATIDGGALKLMASDYEADRLFGLALAAGSVFAMPATLRAIMPAVAENTGFFGVRQVGHFAFGGTATNAGRLTGFWSGTWGFAKQVTGVSGGGKAAAPTGRPGGGGGAGAGPSGGGAGGGVSRRGARPGSGGGGPNGGVSSGSPEGPIDARPVQDAGGSERAGDSGDRANVATGAAPSSGSPLVPAFEVPDPDFTVIGGGPNQMPPSTASGAGPTPNGGGARTSPPAAGGPSGSAGRGGNPSGST